METINKWEEFPWATWMMTSGCNAEPFCSYCIQGLIKGDHPADNQLYTIADGLSTLPGTWMVSLLGGEIMDIPNFSTSIFPFLIENTRHYYSFTSNLAAPLANFIEVYVKGQGRLVETRFSYHYSLW